MDHLHGTGLQCWNWSRSYPKAPAISFLKVAIGDANVMAASNENILLDKLSACHERGTGNTRMKDYDDLLRFLFSKEKFNKDLLLKLAIKRAIPLELPKQYASESIEETWANYRKKFMKKGEDDLPLTLLQLINIINKNLNKISK